MVCGPIAKRPRPELAQAVSLAGAATNRKQRKAEASVQGAHCAARASYYET
jgi:hypothetical protein